MKISSYELNTEITKLLITYIKKMEGQPATNR